MKKKIFTFLTMISSLFLFSQIGVNTATPSATMEIIAKNTTGSTPEGLLLPRVDRKRAQDMLAVKESTIIYVDDISTGTAKDSAINIDEVGFYFYDKVWKKLTTRFSYITYELQNSDRGWINNFNTNISTKDKIVIVVGSRFYHQLVSSRPVNNNANQDYFYTRNVFAWKNGSTWSISADIPYASIVGNGQANWSIDCLIIDGKSNDFPLQRVNFNGQNTATGINPFNR